MFVLCCSSFLWEEDHLHASSACGVGWVRRLWLMRPFHALKVLRQWGQDSPVVACGGGLPMTRDLRAMRFNLAVLMRCASCAAADAPFQIAPRHAGRSWARASHELWSMPKCFREAFRVSLKRFLLATLGACSGQQFTIQDTL